MFIHWIQIKLVVIDDSCGYYWRSFCALFFYMRMRSLFLRQNCKPFGETHRVWKWGCGFQNCYNLLIRIPSPFRYVTKDIAFSKRRQNNACVPFHKQTAAVCTGMIWLWAVSLLLENLRARAIMWVYERWSREHRVLQASVRAKREFLSHYCALSEIFEQKKDCSRLRYNFLFDDGPQMWFPLFRYRATSKT